MKRIRSKLFIGFLCMAALTAGLLWLIQAGIMKDNYLNERVRTIDTALALAGNDAASLQALETGQNVSLMLTDGAGNVLYMSQGMPMRGMMMQRLPQLTAQGANGQVQYLENGMQGARYAAVGKTTANGGTLYAVFSLVDVEEAARILSNQLWIVTAVLLVASLVLAGILARMFARPITDVTRAARDMAEGRLDVSLPVRSNDEIGQLTAALNELGAELQKTENLRRELIANVSHELRAPLTTIKGYAETVRDVTWPDGEKRTEQLTMISEEAFRLSETVNDILDYSRLQAGVEPLNITEFALRPLLTEIVGRYTPEAVKLNLSIRLECPDAAVRFDRGRLVQVMDNLLSNALRHADGGSAVRVDAASVGDRVRVAVKNAGGTIPAAELEHIWDRYYRSERAQGRGPKGTGLGLSIVKRIFETHNAAFGVSSADGETVFWFETLAGERK